jgi:uncharacterized protein (DUF433 family)
MSLRTEMANAKAYIWTDPSGVMRVGESGVAVEAVVAGFLEGDAAETIRQDYPALSLEEVYGAVAEYLANPAEVDEYLKRQDELWERLHAECDRDPPPVVQRLRALRQAPAKRAS